MHMLGQSPPLQMLDLLQGSVSSFQEEVDPRKLCILGLPWDTTEEMLHTYFSQFGPLEESTIIRKAKTGESRGFGFVTYRNAADAQQVRMREHSVGGRHCDAKQALPRGTANPNRTTRLFIGRIPPGVTDYHLRAYFEQFGKVQDAYIPKDPATGKQAHRGFGFVTFASADDVDKVMACAHTLNGQELAVQCAIPKDKGQEFPTPKAQPRWWTSSNESYPSSAESSLSTLMGPVHNYLPYSSPPLPPHGLPASYPVNPPMGTLNTGRFQGDLTGASFQGQEVRSQDAEASSSGQMANGGSLPGLQGSGGSGAHSVVGSMGLMDQASFDRLGLVATSQGHAVEIGSRRPSADMQRLSNGGSMNEQTVQALQGLTFGGTSNGIGIGLALLQARSQAANLPFPQGPNGVPMDMSGQQAFPDIPASLRASLGRPPNFGMRPMQAPNRGAMRPHSQRTAGPERASGSGSGSSHGAGPADANAGPRIFLGKLNKDTNENDVKDYFTRFGFVLDVYMPRDKVKRTEHRGFGFVTFETEAAIHRIATHGPHQIKGSIIAIDSAVPRREEQAGTDHADEQMAHSASNPLTIGASYPLSVLSPTAAGFANGVGSPGSSFGAGGLGSVRSPSAGSARGGSPHVNDLRPGHSLGAENGAQVEEYPNPGSERSFSLERMRNGYKPY